MHYRRGNRSLGTGLKNLRLFHQGEQLTDPTREMENIRRGPTFGDFVLISTEASMQGITVERNAEYKSADSPLPPLFKCKLLRESLSVDNKLFLVQHYREWGRG